MFGNKIIKNIKIEGMSCMHCVKKVESALMDIKGVKSVKVSLDEKQAEITLKEDIDMSVLKQAIIDAGYTVID